MGATASLNNHLKWLSPPLWANRALLVASVHVCMATKGLDQAWFKIVKYLKSVASCKIETPKV